VLGGWLFDPTFVQIVADFFALKADEVEPIDALVDLFSVENSSFQLLDANSEQFFIVSFYFASSSLVAWEILIVELIMAAIVNVLMSSVFGSSRGFLFGPGHFAIFSCEVLDNSAGLFF
jgi:hypothetical protein